MQWGHGSEEGAGLSVAPGSRHFQTFHHPTYGSCYTFNGVWAAQRPGITHGECQPQAEWGRRHPGQPGLTPLLPPGISLVLRTEQQDHLPLLSTEAGIKVMIHERDHTPFLEHQGFSIRPGTETTIGIREVGAPRPAHSPLACPTLGPQGPGQEWDCSVLPPPGRGAPAGEPL